MDWAAHENVLSLTPVDRMTVEFELKVIATDAKWTALTQIKCVKYVPICKVIKRALPPFKVYRERYAALWGPAEVPLKNVLVEVARPRG